MLRSLLPWKGTDYAPSGRVILIDSMGTGAVVELKAEPLKCTDDLARL